MMVVLGWIRSRIIPTRVAESRDSTGTKKKIATLTANAPKHPLSLDHLTYIVLPLPELRLIHLDDRSLPPNLGLVVQAIGDRHLPAKTRPVRYRYITDFQLLPGNPVGEPFSEP